MKTSPSQISASGRRHCPTAGPVTLRLGASLSDAAGAHHCWFRACWHDRHRRAPDGTMAFGAPRPAICDREPARRVHHDRDRGGRAGIPRWLHAAADYNGECHKHDVVQAQLQFPQRHRADRRHLPRAQRHGGAPISSAPRPFLSSLPTPRPTRARSAWRQLAPGPRPTCSARCLKRWPESTWCMCPIAAAVPR